MTALRIGITCYPTFGGSGIVATEVGLALARRGHLVQRRGLTGRGGGLRLASSVERAQVPLAVGRGALASAAAVHGGHQQPALVMNAGTPEHLDKGCRMSHPGLFELRHPQHLDPSALGQAG